MALTVGTDTYIDLEDAEAYIVDYHLSTDKLVTAWHGIVDDDKEVLLRLAAKKIDCLALVGSKASTAQTMEFPRAVYTEYDFERIEVAYTYLDDSYYIQPAVPDNVKYAQVEIALQLAYGIPERVSMQMQGVKSFSLGKLSESYSGGYNSLTISPEAADLLAPYLARSVRIC